MDSQATTYTEISYDEARVFVELGIEFEYTDGEQRWWANKLREIHVFDEWYTIHPSWYKFRVAVE